MKSIKKNIIFTALTVLLVIIFLEVTLNLLAHTSYQVAYLLGSPWATMAVHDERLGNRPNPAFPEHDRNGFRNPEVPAKADVVALGDSQTYGTGVKPEEAWPWRLEQMIGKTVYSMAFGGYGPVHSLILWDEVMVSDPKIVIEAFYAGNDLVDAFNIVYNNNQRVGLKSSDPQVQATVRELEESESIREQVSRIFHMGVTNVQSNNTSTRTKSFHITFLSEHSRIYGLLRRMKYELSHFNKPTQDPWEHAKAYAEKHSAYTQVFKNGQFRTIFTPEYRFTALNLKDPRIAEGSKIVLRALQRMKELATDSNVRFIVLLIPTKELVFQELSKNLPSPAYHSLTDNEVTLWNITKGYLKRNGIEYIDALPALRQQLVSGVQPYQVSTDGHPNEHGHKAIATLIAAYLKTPH